MLDNDKLNWSIIYNQKRSFTIIVSKELFRFIFKDSKVSSASTEFLDLIYQFIQ